MKGNKASIRVMEKVGMVFEKFAPYEPGGEDIVWYCCKKNLSLKINAIKTDAVNLMEHLL